MKTLMRNGRDRRSENPFWATAKKERVVLFGTDQRITSGPAAKRLHSKMLWGGGEEIACIAADVNRWSPPMQTPNDLSQSRIVLKQDSTLIAVIEMSLSTWLVAGIVPGVERQPLKKLAVDESALLKLLNRWREEAEKAGRRI